MPLVEIKDFNAFIDNKPFFNQSIKNKQEPYKKRNEMSRNNGYTTGNVLDYLYNQNIINLLVQICQEKKIRGFLNKLILYDDDCATMFFLSEKQKKLF